MCDYSLEHYRTAKAKQGETLTLHRFPSNTKGFISAGDCETAACVAPGTQLVMEMPEIIQNLWCVSAEELVTMTVIHPDPAAINCLYVEGPTGERYMQGHRDAVEISTEYGTAKLLLQWFPAGVKARVAVLATGQEDAELADKNGHVEGVVVGVEGPQPVDIWF